MTLTAVRRMRSKTVLLGITTIAASQLTGCASDKPDYAAICTDPQTHQRVDDDECDDSDHDYNGGGSGFFWFYMATRGSSPIPAVGSRYSDSSGRYDGSHLSSTGKSVQRGGLPKTGGTSVKSFTKSGGFGGSKGVSSSS